MLQLTTSLLLWSQCGVYNPYIIYFVWPLAHFCLEKCSFVITVCRHRLLVVCAYLLESVFLRGACLFLTNCWKLIRAIHGNFLDIDTRKHCPKHCSWTVHVWFLSRYHIFSCIKIVDSWNIRSSTQYLLFIFQSKIHFEKQINKTIC